MSRYRKFAGFIIAIECVIILCANVWLAGASEALAGRMYEVEISRVVNRMEAGESIQQIDLAEYPHIISVQEFRPTERIKEPYTVEEVKGKLYQFAYRQETSNKLQIAMNAVLGVMVAVTAFILWYLGKKVIRPFDNIRELPIELSKGNLTVPIPEEKSKYFGRFLWGMDMLREKLEDDKARELSLLKERKTLILSLSHDVKTPLSAIDLYTKALKNNLYQEEEKRIEAMEGIEKNAAEIKEYVNAIVHASRNEIMSFKVQNGEVYLRSILDEIKTYYQEKLKLNRTDFTIQKTENCLVHGDKDRIVEVLQNIMENAIKYGDGNRISITVDEEENCKLILVENTGCQLKEEELPQLFDSFYRGSNSANIAGSGLGLYICKELMHQMDGEIFAKISGGSFGVTLVLKKV